MTDMVRLGSPLTTFPPEVQPYVELIDAFLSDRLPVASFERTYMDTYLNDKTHWLEPVYEALNEVFLDIDAYYPDPEIRDEDGIDEEELRVRVARSLEDLKRAV